MNAQENTENNSKVSLNDTNNDNDNENENSQKDTETENSKKEEEEFVKEIPQDPELIETIVKEANENKNNPTFIPETAKQANFNVEKNDPRLKITMKDGSCQFYSLLYVTFRDPSLKRIFEPKVLKNDTDYYILSKVEGENITFRIPCSTIAEEKSKNRGHLFPCDEEYVSALGVYLHALLLMKCGFIDRLAYQPFFSTDAFFDQKIRNVGFGFSLVFNNENKQNENKEQENQNENDKKSQDNLNTNLENQNENKNLNIENEIPENETKTCTEINCSDKSDDSTERKNGDNLCNNPHYLSQKPEISLASEQNRIDLFNDGSIFIKETSEFLEGHYIICISIFPKKNTFGHCLFMFFNVEEKKWKLYNSCPDKEYGEYGEMDLEQMKSFFFNGSCVIAGVPNEDL